MKILGIDYGEKKIGLSVSEGEFITPIGILLNTKELEEKIKELIQKEGIGKIVIGISEGRLNQKQREFGAKIVQTLSLPVVFWDETLTSREAVKKMIESGRSRKRRRLEDAVAAALILESYLESQRK